MSHLFKRNQHLSLRALGSNSSLLVIGLGWRNKRKPGLLNRLRGKHYHSDLDLSCVLYDSADEKLDTVWYAQLQSKCGGIRHKGDETVGAINTDNETILFDLNQIDSDTKTLFFVVSTFTGRQFAHIEDAYWRLYDPALQREIGRFHFSGHQKVNAKIVLRLQKAVNDDGLTIWQATAIDQPATGKNIQEVLPEIRDLLDQNPAR